MKRLLIYELKLWAALYRWILRRPLPVAPGTTRFQYAGAVAPLFGVFLGLSALEIPILHLLLPWAPVRKISLVVGAYGLFWMFGLLATLRVYPHLVGPAGLRIRNSSTVDVEVAWTAVAEIRLRRRSLPPGGQTQMEDGVLSFGVGSQTSVDVRLAHPLTVDHQKTRGEPVTEIRFHADDPEALIAAAGAHLTARNG